MKDVAESAMREIVGQSDIQPILTEARAKTEARRADADAEDPRLLRRRRPDRPRCSCRRSIRRSRSSTPSATCRRRAPTRSVCRTRRTPTPTASSRKRRGEAERILQAAQGYRDSRRSPRPRARPTASSRSIEQYKKAPDVTRKRMFLETMERVLGDTDKIIVDRRRGPGRGALSCRSTEFTKKAPGAGRGEPAMNRDRSHRQPDRPRHCRGRAPISRCSRSTRRSRRSCSSSASRSAIINEPGLHYKIPFIQNVDYLRQAHSRPRHRVAGGDRLRPEAARGRRLCALPHHRSAAVLPVACATSASPIRGSAPSSKPRSGACSAARPSRPWCATSARR